MIALKSLNFVTGKGGVGKSTIAAMLALAESKKGRKVLLVELGEKSFFEKFFHMKTPATYEPQLIAPNLSLSLWSYRACLREYVGFYIKSSKVYDLFFDNSVMQKFIQAAPALKELAILGKATSGPRKIGPPMGFDCIVIDSYSTGHHKALLSAPLAMGQAIQQGPMGHHSEKIFEVISDPLQTQHIVVLKPEDVPTLEGLELYEYLRKQWKIESELVLNQYMDYPVSVGALEELSKNASSADLKELSHQFSQFLHEQNDSKEKVPKKTVTTSFCFEKQNPWAFLENIFEKTRPL